MDLVKVDSKEYGVEETKALEIQGLFKPMIDKMVELEAQYNVVVKLPINEETAKKARVLRLKYRDTRTGTANIHKELKDPYLKMGRFLDNWKSTQKTASEGMEEKLLTIEKHFENVEKERIQKLQESRELELEKYEVSVIPQNLGEMAAEVWNSFLIGSKATYEAKKKAEKEEAERLEQERIAAEEKAEKERLEEIEKEKERKRIAAENAKLKKEAQEKEEKVRKEKAAAAAKAKKELDKKNAEIAKQKAEAEKLRKEKEEREAKEKAEQEAKEEAARKAAAAPDKEKLLAFGESLLNLELPTLTTKHGASTMESVSDLLKKVNNYIIEQSENF
jgi:hypothetical protein